MLTYVRIQSAVFLSLNVSNVALSRPSNWPLLYLGRYTRWSDMKSIEYCEEYYRGSLEVQLALPLHKLPHSSLKTDDFGSEFERGSQSGRGSYGIYWINSGLEL